MSLTYTWKLIFLRKKNIDNLASVIFQTHWQKIGADENGNTGAFAGTTEFDLTKVDPNNFVPYDQLTEALVLGWIQASIDAQYDEQINLDIQRKINEKINSANVVSVFQGAFPWSPPAEGTPVPSQTQV